MSNAVNGIDLEVFRKYAGLSLPRHVSYPMPTWWHDVDGAEAAALQLDSRARTPANDLSLYLHVPFCEQACRYCACTRITQEKCAPGATERTEAYVRALRSEIRDLGQALGKEAGVRQMHWGGGTPTYLSIEQFESVHDEIRASFTVSPEAEIAIELDPRATSTSMLYTLRRLGFRRVSLGVQDFNEQVQEHVRRIQPYEMVRDMVLTCRNLGFESVNFDLIYGLPYQTPATIRETLERTIQLSPDRIAYYLYAQIPGKIASQRGLDYTKLPDSETKLEMFLTGLQVLTAAGYQFIGLDHFAKPREGLAVALKEDTLQRNFQGMTTGGGLDLIGLGASSISHLAGVGFLQNVRGLEDYLARVEGGTSPIYRGKRFTEDDRIRQAVLSELYCAAQVRPAVIEEQFDVVFGDYFARELGILEELARDGLVTVEEDGRIQATLPLGRVLMRTIASVFDAYLPPDAYRVGDRECFSANA